MMQFSKKKSLPTLSNFIYIAPILNKSYFITFMFLMNLFNKIN